jgi:putative peptide zinc metalloprotease protein
VKEIFLKSVASKRVAALTLAFVLILGIGSASAEFQPTGDPTTSGEVTQASPSPEVSPEPEASLSAEGVVPPNGGGGNVNNEVVVINTVDSRFAHRAGVGFARVTGREAHNQNAAAATSSCNDCRTVAVAAQAVVVQRTDASDISPRNFAVAINADCVRCETFAAAYQLVFTTDGLVRFAPGAEQRMAALEGEIRAVAGNEELSFSELEARIDALVEETWAVVKGELEAVGMQGTGRPSKDTDEKTTGDESPSPSPSPSESTSPSPSPDASESPGTSEQEPSPTPEPTETATPATEPEEIPSPGPA